jgi:hypothetical protein
MSTTRLLNGTIQLLEEGKVRANTILRCGLADKLGDDITEGHDSGRLAIGIHHVQTVDTGALELAEDGIKRVRGLDGVDVKALGEELGDGLGERVELGWVEDHMAEVARGDVADDLASLAEDGDGTDVLWGVSWERQGS